MYIFITKDWYVNGAQMLVMDLVADNGVVHLIDRLFYEGGKDRNAMSYITDIKQGTEDFQTM